MQVGRISWQINDLLAQVHQEHMAFHQACMAAARNGDASPNLAEVGANARNKPNNWKPIIRNTPDQLRARIPVAPRNGPLHPRPGIKRLGNRLIGLKNLNVRPAAWRGAVNDPPKGHPIPKKNAHKKNIAWVAAVYRSKVLAALGKPNKPNRRLAQKQNNQVAKPAANNFANTLNLNIRNAELKGSTRQALKDILQENRAVIVNGKPNAVGLIELKRGNKRFFVEPLKGNAVNIWPLDLRDKKNNPAHGAFKKAEFVGLQWIGLKVVDPRANFLKEARKDNSDIEALGLKTFYANKVVTPQLMIGRNAGQPFKADPKSIKTVNIRAFYPAAKDLATVHRHGIYLTDIKVENMAFDGEKVNFIDIDSRVKTRKGVVYRGEFLSTLSMATKELDRGRLRSTNPEEQRIYFKTADEYAFLLSVIAATAGSANVSLRKAVLQPQVDNIKINNVQPFSHPGALNDFNKHLFDAWVVKNIKPAFRECVFKMLKNPGDLARSRYMNRYSPSVAINASLVDMLNF